MASIQGPSAVAGQRPGAAIYPTSPLGETVEGIPTGRDVEWQPLVDYRRNGVSETTIHGGGQPLPMQSYERDYLSEKLECIYGHSLDAIMKKPGA